MDSKKIWSKKRVGRDIDNIKKERVGVISLREMPMLLPSGKGHRRGLSSGTRKIDAKKHCFSGSAFFGPRHRFVAKI